MKRHAKHQELRFQNAKHRIGAVAPLLAVLCVPLLGMLAFSIDYGYLKVVESELQRAADAGVLAGVLDLVPAPDGSQSPDRVRATVKAYVQRNLADSPAGDITFTVLDADIEIGRYDENTINGTAPVTLHSTGLWDCVRVTLRRDDSANGGVNLFFARLLGTGELPVTVTATAVLRRGTALKTGADVLPFALPISFWDGLAAGEELSIYNDNKIYDSSGNEATVTDSDGNPVSGNWGTVDIGYQNNSTSDLANQILHGIVAGDIQALNSEGRVPTADEIPLPVTFQADPGISLGIKDEVQAIYGQTRLIPLYDYISGDITTAVNSGNNPEFHIVAWGVVEVVDSWWNGNANTSITAVKAYTYDGAIVPQQDLTNKRTLLKNTFTSPVLVR